MQPRNFTRHRNFTSTLQTRGTCIKTIDCSQVEEAAESPTNNCEQQLIVESFFSDWLKWVRVTIIVSVGILIGADNGLDCCSSLLESGGQCFSFINVVLRSSFD